MAEDTGIRKPLDCFSRQYTMFVDLNSHNFQSRSGGWDEICLRLSSHSQVLKLTRRWKETEEKIDGETNLEPQTTSILVCYFLEIVASRFRFHQPLLVVTLEPSLKIFRLDP